MKRKQIAKKDRPALMERAFEMLQSRDPGFPCTAKETAAALGVGVRTVIRWKSTVLKDRLDAAYEVAYVMRCERLCQEEEQRRTARRAAAKQAYAERMARKQLA